MNKKVYFSMVFHCHQPVGNFGFVLEKAYQKAYLPLLDSLLNHPNVKAALHFSGILFDEYENTHPEMFEKIKLLLKRGQIEMLTGGYYEPILVSIADRDKISQIKMMNRYLKQTLNVKAKGLWCAERVWEPYLPKPLSLAGVEYTLIDDNIFKRTGLSSEEIRGYFVTEEQGHMLKVLPIDHDLRYAIPEGKPEDVIEILQRDSKVTNPLFLFGDDGEKFGFWPNTFEKVWEEGWMEKLFTLLEKNKDWICLVTPSEYMRMFPPLGRVYLPVGSYFEMGIWAYPLKKRERYENFKEVLGGEDFLREFGIGGMWKSFLAKYSEADRLHKRVLYLSEKIQKMVSSKKAEAMRMLFKAQCNCAYWHGVFGGIYLPHLRHALHKSLIKAEKKAYEEFYPEGVFKEIEKVDINLDLANEVLVNTPHLQMIFSPKYGGSLTDLIYKEGEINLGNTLMRRKEAYHLYVKDNPKAKNMVKYLGEDAHPRYSFIDHFISPYVTMQEFKDGNFVQKGSFIGKPYDVFTSEKDENVVVTLSRQSTIGNVPCELEKTFLISEDEPSFKVQLWLSKKDEVEEDIIYALETNLFFLSFKYPESKIIVETQPDEDYVLKEELSLEEEGTHVGLKTLTLQSNEYKMDIHLSSPASLWHYPIYTVSRSEEGFEKVYQQTAFVLLFDIPKDEDTWDTVIDFSISKG